MPVTFMRDLNLVGKFVGLHTFLSKIENVNGSGTIALVGDYISLPSEKPYKFKRIKDSHKIEEKTGDDGNVIEKIIGCQYSSTLNQRDAETFELDTGFAGFDCVLLASGHIFDKLTPVKRGWLGIFGTVLLHDADVDSSTGEVPFTFVGRRNNRAVKWEHTPTTGIAYPSDTALQANVDIPATGTDIEIAPGAIYKLIDVADV